MRNVLPIAALLALFIAGSAWVSQPSEAAGDAFGESKVKLFSNGQVVGEWLAVGPGHVEGSTFVFPVRKGARELEVRISGTYSFEQNP